MRVYIGCITSPWSSQHFDLSGSLELLLHHLSYLRETWLAGRGQKSQVFWHFGLKMPIHAQFLGVWETYFPQMTSPIVVTPKRHLLAQKYVIWAIKRENRSNGSTWVCAQEKKDRRGQSKKSQRCYISPSWGEAPTEPICTQICMVVAIPNAITYAKFGTEIFRSYNFTGGRILGFPIYSCMCLKTVQRYFAACD